MAAVDLIASACQVHRKDETVDVVDTLKYDIPPSSSALIVAKILHERLPSLRSKVGSTDGPIAQWLNQLQPLLEAIVGKRTSEQKASIPEVSSLTLDTTSSDSCSDATSDEDTNGIYRCGKPFDRRDTHHRDTDLISHVF